MFNCMSGPDYIFDKADETRLIETNQITQTLMWFDRIVMVGTQINLSKCIIVTVVEAIHQLVYRFNQTSADHLIHSKPTIHFTK